MWDDHTVEVKPITSADEEYLQRVRRMIARLDRWRPAAVAFYSVLMVAYIAVLLFFNEVIRGGFFPGLGPGLAAGIALGGSAGLLLVQIAHGLAGALFHGRRGDRLLLQYHDMIQEMNSK